MSQLKWLLIGALVAIIDNPPSRRVKTYHPPYKSVPFEHLNLSGRGLVTGPGTQTSGSHGVPHTRSQLGWSDCFVAMRRITVQLIFACSAL